MAMAEFYVTVMSTAHLIWSHVNLPLKSDCLIGSRFYLIKMTVLALQTSGEAVIAGSFFMALVVATVVSLITYFVLRRGLNALKSQFNDTTGRFNQIADELSNLKQDLPWYDEVKDTKEQVRKMQDEQGNLADELSKLKQDLPRYDEIKDTKEQVRKMQDEQGNFTGNISDQIDSFKRAQSEEIQKVRKDTVELAERKAVEAAKVHVESNSVSREEFDRLRQHIERSLGAEELADRLIILRELFDSGNIRTLMWQCKLIRLTERGLAPEAEEDVMVQSGIPLSSAKTFLRKLNEIHIADLRKVDSYHLVPEYTWLLTYTENPDWLQRRMENYIRREEDYQKHISENIGIVEEGMILVSAQYEVDSGRIDILCRDKNGKDVGMELKYPAASNEVIGQILRYIEDYKRKNDIQGMRFVLVAPKIPDKLKNLLASNNLEYKEITF